ncbi:MAG TPA: fructosamine kinase family protein [Streptosporangiaceae bacterium]|nr:fructosamine kinase family protein [Streptosporangiaceae bacterium]
MSSVADRLAGLTGRPVRAVRTVGAQHGHAHLEIEFADGTRGFGKVGGASGAGASPFLAEKVGGASGAGASPFLAEANGLRWLAEAGQMPVPEVLGADEAALVVALVAPLEAASAAAANRFGGDLARLHAAGSSGTGFGAPWPGFIASLPLDNSPGTSWPAWYAERRLLPFVRMAVESGALRAADGALVERVVARIDSLAGPSGAEPPSRIHGDCWSGNVLWSGGRGWLIDPAAHGGHRETDLAMLALFGAPHLPDILAGYQDAMPLAAGWQARVPLHQLHPLLVHACLFGSSYRSGVCAAARAALGLSAWQLPGVRNVRLVLLVRDEAIGRKSANRGS